MHNCNNDESFCYFKATATSRETYNSAVDIQQFIPQLNQTQITQTPVISQIYATLWLAL